MTGGSNAIEAAEAAKGVGSGFWSICGFIVSAVAAQMLYASPSLGLRNLAAHVIFMGFGVQLFLGFKIRLLKAFLVTTIVSEMLSRIALLSSGAAQRENLFSVMCTIVLFNSAAGLAGAVVGRIQQRMKPMAQPGDPRTSGKAVTMPQLRPLPATGGAGGAPAPKRRLLGRPALNAWFVGGFLGVLGWAAVSVLAVLWVLHRMSP